MKIASESFGWKPLENEREGAGADEDADDASGSRGQPIANLFLPNSSYRTSTGLLCLIPFH
jgi:hypothetical protein